jgi:uncharacterized protein YvpB
MALGAHGIEVTEDALIDHLPFVATPKRNGVWGDPNKGFVGRIDGQMLVDGYGVYADPLADVARRWAQAEVLRSASVQDLTGHIDRGNPVIVWGYYGSGRRYHWRTPDEASIVAVSAEHTRVVTGYAGTADVPTGFYLLDPLLGSLYWARERFEENWSSLGRMALVVLPDV